MLRHRLLQRLALLLLKVSAVLMCENSGNTSALYVIWWACYYQVVVDSFLLMLLEYLALAGVSCSVPENFLESLPNYM